MIIKEIISSIEEVAPLTYQESYDNAGLILGRSNQNVTSALLTIDITEEVIDEAISLGASLIISHHPLIFNGIKKINEKNEIERCIVKAIKNSIALYAAHTNIDSVFNGVNSKICEKLGLKNCQILSPKSNFNKENNFLENANVGSGMIGDLEKDIELDIFLKIVKQTFNCGVIKYNTSEKTSVFKVAVCGGAGSFLIAEAKNAQADIFLTGDVKYHDFFLPDNKMVIADIGHYESEQYTKEIFYEIINKKFPKFALHFSKVITNPINYL